MKTYIYILLFTITSSLCAQNDVVSGIVVDNVTGEPLPFTNIGVIGKSEGTVSNSEGNFTLNIEKTTTGDSLFFSFVGYDPLRLAVDGLGDTHTFKLQKRAVQLTDFSVLSREYSPIEIIDLLKKNYSKNHSTAFQHQRLFSRDANYNKIHKSDMKFKGSSFDAINESFVDQINSNTPEELNFYNDHLVDLLYSDKEKKLLPIEGQSLFENWNFDEEFDKQLGMFAGDVESDVRDDESYFKVRSGVFAGKLDFGSDSAFTMTEDSTHFILSTDVTLGDLNYLIRQYSTINSKRFDFFHEYKWYDYQLSDVAIVNDELAYIISFVPAKRKGKYEGTICVSTESFALLQVDYAFAEGKKGKGMSLLGVEYEVISRSGRAIFEKGENGHHLKYLARESKERFGVNRTLTLKRKQEKGLFDKTLQELKVKVDFDVTLEQKKEVLVIEQNSITKEEFDQAVQPNTSLIKKVDKYESGIWKNSSIIEPTKALKEYEQQY